MERPRKWSTRWIWFSGTSFASSAFSASALATSVPNGFSRASVCPAGQRDLLSAVAGRDGDGGRQGEVDRRARPRTSRCSFCSSAGSVTSAFT